MSKSYKLSNDKYIDSTCIYHRRLPMISPNNFIWAKQHKVEIGEWSSVALIIIHWADSELGYIYTAGKLLEFFKNNSGSDTCTYTIEDNIITFELSNTGIIDVLRF